jgi:propionate CoA-transferase
MANQFDLYDNGGLDICFMGAFEVDREGNVNAHQGPGNFSGIGGFANITARTPNVVFCLTFNTKGLSATRKKDVVTIHENGRIPKFVEKVRSVSFSAKRAVRGGQRVLYITERCVFMLCEAGLRLIEVYPGVDLQRDVLDLLPFPEPEEDLDILVLHNGADPKDLLALRQSLEGNVIITKTIPEGRRWKKLIRFGE